MDTSCSYLSFAQTRAFSRITTDYLATDPKLAPFYLHPVSLQGMRASIAARQAFPTDRERLVNALRDQYHAFTLTPRQQENLEALLQPNTFTITTAHQPNIFTGPLYFLYKIMHTIRIANEMRVSMPEFTFVPVYYMGSEDADLDELGHIFLEGEKVEWDTDQTGAVGRMHTRGLEKIVQRLQGQYGHLPYAGEVIALCRKAYLEHPNVQQATLYLVNELFKNFGLLILTPDNAKLKQAFVPIVKRELLEQFSQSLVAATTETLGQHYKVQATGRPINLFYLDESGRRERIEKEGDKWVVKTLGLTFSEAEIIHLAETRPELFSANVILRGLFQETVLPNLAFVGGGGELAYWLELRAVFKAAGVPYPMLVLRNSFLLVEEKWAHLQQKLGLANESLFDDVDNWLLQWAADKHGELPELGPRREELNALYRALQEMTGSVDITLKGHVAALNTRALKGLEILEKKLKRAQKRKMAAERDQSVKLKQALFPQGSLQERTENGLPFLAKYGPAFLDSLYQYCTGLDTAFGIIHLNEQPR